MTTAASITAGVRHPVQAGSREDRAAAEEALAQLAGLEHGDHTIEVMDTTIKISNVDKVLYPEAGFTKLDMARYYAAIAPVLLPHLRERALTLKRYPNGVDAQYFYQKRCPVHRPEWVRTEGLITDTKKTEPIDYCIPEDVRGLMWATSLADIELHVLLSRVEDVQRPTVIAFDLDPGEGVDVLGCAEVAVLVRDLFAHLGSGLESYVKTSGSKGLQVYVPLNDPAISYDRTKPFAKTLAQLLEREHPDLVVHKMLKELRTGKVLVDWSQNDPHKTTVCVYSLRAKPQPTISTPVTWDELEHALAVGDPDLLRFTWQDALARVDECGGDLFAPVLTQRQELPSFDGSP